MDIKAPLRSNASVALVVSYLSRAHLDLRLQLLVIVITWMSVTESIRLESSLSCVTAQVNCLNNHLTVMTLEKLCSV